MLAAVIININENAVGGEGSSVKNRREDGTAAFRNETGVLSVLEHSQGRSTSPLPIAWPHSQTSRREEHKVLPLQPLPISPTQ